MLSPYRVLDLTDDRGHLAGFVLAQLGAEVISVEPEGGQRARHIGPFAGDTPHPDRSLLQWSYDRGKSSVVLCGPQAAEQLEHLAAGADVLVECGAPPADLLDLEALRQRHPALITVSLSPFGATGPKAGWVGTDLTLAAASGQVALTGDHDRPPVRISVPQVWANTGSEAACAVLVALHERERSGLGQHIDVSAQEAMMLSVQGWMAPALVGAPTMRRLAGGAELFGFDFRFVYECLDGHVTTSFLPGVLVGPFTNRLLAWVHEQGGLDDDLAAVDWCTLLDDFDLDEMRSVAGRSMAALAACLSRWPKAELLAISRQRHFLMMPIATPADVLASEQFAFRGFWDEVAIVDEAGSGADAGADAAGRVVRFPGPYAHSDAAPLHRLGRAPRLGEHTESLLAAPRRARPCPPTAGSPAGGALSGVRVVDLTWVYAGPFATRLLAYHGATVIRVESSTHPDQVRSPSIPRDPAGGAENSVQWHSINADKLSLQLNLRVPEARQVMLDLAASSDLLISAFAPGVMERLGLGPEALRAVNPRLITVSSCLFGHQGPLSAIPGFGNMGAASGGFYELTGWPDRLPAGPYLAYTDATSPRLTAALMLAALLWSRRSGRGTHLDFSQAEGGVHFLTPAVAELEVNGRLLTRCGNQDPAMAPHGVYPVSGEDRWVALACEDDRQWCTLAGLLGRDDLAPLDASQRRARRDELDALVADWTAGWDPVALQERLQALGIPAHQVQNGPECVADPQLLHRNHFARVPHPVHGHSWADQYGFRLSRTPGTPHRAGPTWGEHNEEVLMGLLGYDVDRLAELAIAGALE